MTTAEFSRAAGIPATAVTRLIREGKIRARKEGKSWKIDASQLEARAVRELAGKAGERRQRRPLRRSSGGPEAKTGARSRAAAAPPPEAPPQAPPGGAAAQEAPAAAEATYSVEEFAAMTYLTAQGVREWLRIGRLRGVCTPSGEWRVAESNLSIPDISRLLRK